MRNYSRRSVLKIAGTTGIAASLSGCTSSPLGGGGGEAAKVGILSPLSGKYAKFGQLWTDFQEVLIDEIVNEDPPLGSEVEVFVSDTQSRPDVAVQAGRDLVNNNGVDITEQAGSESLVALQDFFAENEVIHCAPVAGTSRLSDREGKWIFRFISPDDQSGRAWAVYAKNEAGYQTAASLFLNDPGGKPPAKAFEEKFKSIGGEIAASVPLSLNRSSYRQQIQKAFESDPDVAAMSTSVPTGSQVLKQWFQTDLGGQWILSAAMRNEELIKQVDTKILDSVVAMAGTGQGPGYEKFMEFHKNNIGESIGAFTANAYDATVVPMLAVEHAGTTDGSAVSESMYEVARPPGKNVSTYQSGIDSLRNGNEINYEGAASNCNFNEHGDVVTPFGVFEVEGGEWKEVLRITPEEIKD